MKISKNHPNRQLHNWLLYDIGDKFIKKYSKYYKGNIYDLGCGEKPFEDFMEQYATKYIGVDWSDTYHNLKADIVADLNNKFPINSDVADTIISISVMEHLSDPQIFLNESYRILKKDGYIILEVPWQWWLHEEPYDYYRYTPYSLTKMFEEAGYKDIKIEASSGIFTTLIMKINYLSVRLLKGPKYFRRFIKLCLLPFWFVGQVLAPYLDKLDSNWKAESHSYYVSARK
jgi:SAM-dependent methyltransferase